MFWALKEILEDLGLTAEEMERLLNGDVIHPRDFTAPIKLKIEYGAGITTYALFFFSEVTQDWEHLISVSEHN